MNTKRLLVTEYVYTVVNVTLSIAQEYFFHHYTVLHLLHVSCVTLLQTCSLLIATLRMNNLVGVFRPSYVTYPPR